MGIKKKKTQTRTKPGGTSVRPMLNVRKDTTSDRYTLVIRILRARRRGVVFTPFKLLPEEFDPVKGRAVPNLNIREHRRFVDNVNRYLRHQLHEIDRIVSELELVGELDEPAVMEFRDFLVREGLSVNTMTFYLSKLRAVYNRAVRGLPRRAWTRSRAFPSGWRRRASWPWTTRC